MATRASEVPDRADRGHHGPRPRPQAAAHQRDESEAGQTADGVDDDVGGVGAPDTEDVLRHLQRQAAEATTPADLHHDHDGASRPR